MNYAGGPNVVTCEQCMLSSRLTSQYNVCSFVVLKRPPCLMITVATHWYDNYGLAVLQQLQDLTWARQFVGLLILGISALIATITSVTVAAVSLSQQVHTAQYVDTMSKNVSLTLATDGLRTLESWQGFKSSVWHSRLGVARTSQERMCKSRQRQHSD